MIVGASKGLGKHLANHFTHDNVYTLSRASIESNISHHIQSDVSCVTDQQLSLLPLKGLDAIIYLPSNWGESGLLKTEELESFFAAGPVGFLTLFNKLNDKGYIAKNAKVISIGSTAEESDKGSYPCYSLAKGLQKQIAKKLQKIHTSFHFTHITLGSLGDNLVDYESMSLLLTSIFSMNNSVYATAITIKSIGEL